MGVPTGEVIARPMMPRACGCLCEFQHYAVDKTAQRLAKFQSTRCPECVAKSEAEQRARPPRCRQGEAIQSSRSARRSRTDPAAERLLDGDLARRGTTVDGTGDDPQADHHTGPEWLMPAVRGQAGRGPGPEAGGPAKGRGPSPAAGAVRRRRAAALAAGSRVAGGPNPPWVTPGELAGRDDDPENDDRNRTAPR